MARVVMRPYWCPRCQFEQEVEEGGVLFCCDCKGPLFEAAPLVTETWPCCGALRTPGNHAEGCSSADPDRKPESVLSEAARLVDGDRQQAYGHPKDNHACTAALWNAYLERRAEAVLPKRGVRHPAPLDAFDVCMLNILQKVSRLAHSRQRDGLVDLAGFARNAEMVDE